MPCQASTETAFESAFADTHSSTSVRLVSDAHVYIHGCEHCTSPSTSCTLAYRFSLCFNSSLLFADTLASPSVEAPKEEEDQRSCQLACAGPRPTETPPLAVQLSTATPFDTLSAHYPACGLGRAAGVAPELPPLLPPQRPEHKVYRTGLFYNQQSKFLLARGKKSNPQVAELLGTLVSALAAIIMAS